MKKLYTLIILLAFSYMNCFSQETFIKQFKPNNQIIGTGVVHAANSDYFITAGNDSDFYISKMTNGGKVLWEKRLGVKVNGVKCTSSDGGIEIFSVTPTKPYSLIAFKCDSNGNIAWQQKLLPSKNQDQIQFIQAFEDSKGNYIAFYQIPNDTYPPQLRILKLDKNGKVLFFTGIKNIYNPGVSQHFIVRTIEETFNGNYLIGLAYSCSVCEAGRDGYLVLVNKEGDIMNYFQAEPEYTSYDDSFYPLYVTKHNAKYTMVGLYTDALKDYAHEFYYCIASFNANESTTEAHIIPYNSFALQRYLRQNMKWLEYQNDGYFVINSRNVFLAGPPLLKKFDSLGRICPTYADTNFVYDTSTRLFTINEVVKYGNKVLDTLTISPLNIKNAYVHWLTTFCEGNNSFTQPTDKNNFASNDIHNDVVIYPNPAKDILSIKGLSLAYQTTLTVIDFMGNLKLQEIAKNSDSYNLNITSLAPGNYLLKIETFNGIVTKKFFKE
jgi:type IX secretion system substrate protein